MLADTIEEAQQTLRGGEDVEGGKWWEDAVTEDVCHLASLTSLYLRQDYAAFLLSDTTPLS